jgi:hypothetical protein
MSAGTKPGSVADGVESDPILPLTLYGPEVSYFTGKLEAVVRFLELPYERVAKGPTDMTQTTGVAQVPGLQLADGRWLTDSTPIIAWLDARYPDAGVIPRDPVVAFFSRLLEDYADEWLWRPAMHYRWDYPEGAQHLSRVLVDEAARHIPLPGGQVPDDWGPTLDSIGSAYLPYLCANAEAWQAGQSHFDVDIEGAPYRRIRTARYRIWCLQELRRHFDELSGPQQEEVRARLEAHGCWEPLWRVGKPDSGLDPERTAPFAGSHSMTGLDSSAAEKIYWVPAAKVRP